MVLQIFRCQFVKIILFEMNIIAFILLEWYCFSTTNFGGDVDE